MFHTKTIIDFAVIIPTLNEERFIGRLLDSIITQTVAPAEVVVVDAYSEDNTIEEVKKRKLTNLRYFQIPKSTISRQRNLGVKKTISPHLLFLDADMEFREADILGKYFQEVIKIKPDVAAATTLPDSSHWKDLIYFQVEDLVFKITQYFWPVVTARNLYVRREIFDKVGGFDEDLAVGEDTDLVQRIVKRGGRLIFLKTVKLHTSIRRVVREGRRNYALKMILFGVNIFLRGRKKSTVEYEFGKFKHY